MSLEKGQMAGGVAGRVEGLQVPWALAARRESQVQAVAFADFALDLNLTEECLGREGMSPDRNVVALGGSSCAAHVVGMMMGQDHRLQAAAGGAVLVQDGE